MCITRSGNSIKKEYIISRIEASQDGSPYVYVTFSDPNGYKPGTEKLRIDSWHTIYSPFVILTIICIKIFYIAL